MVEFRVSKIPKAETLHTLENLSECTQGNKPVNGEAEDTTRFELECLYLLYDYLGSQMWHQIYLFTKNYTIGDDICILEV